MLNLWTGQGSFREATNHTMTIRQITIAKTHTLTVDDSKLAEHVREYVFAYGLKQVLNDAGSQGKTPEQKFGMAEKKLDALLRGEIAATRESDPVTARAKAIAKDRLNKAFKAKGMDPAEHVTKFTSLWQELAAKPEIREVAQAQVDAERGLDLDIEI